MCWDQNVNGEISGLELDRNRKQSHFNDSEKTREQNQGLVYTESAF